MVRFLPIGGTHSWSGAPADSWWHTGSPWLQMMHGQHACVPYAPDRPFVWTTGLDGVHLWPFGRRRHRTWNAAAWNLFAYLVPPTYGGYDNGVGIPPHETRIVCHSHALSVVLMACALGLKVRSLISLCSPIRHDLMDMARIARPNIASWTHVHHKGFDLWQFAGGLTDSHLGHVQKHPLADRNISLPGIGHTGLLTDPSQFHCWQAGLIPYLTW